MINKKNKRKAIVVVCKNKECEKRILLKHNEVSKICECGAKATRKNKKCSTHFAFECPSTKAVLMKTGRKVFCNIPCGQRGSCNYNLCIAT